jgi:hypothetical protein
MNEFIRAATILVDNASEDGRFSWRTSENSTGPILQGLWLVKHVIPQTGLGVIFGRPGCGKTFAALDLGLSIAAGTAWRGHRVRQAEVVWRITASMSMNSICLPRLGSGPGSGRCQFRRAPTSSASTPQQIA